MTAADFRSVTCPGAGFLSAELREGDLVRVQPPAGPAAFGVILGARNEDVLEVEEWLHDETRRPVPAPTAGTVFAYRVVLGRVRPRNPSADPPLPFVPIHRWHDLEGADVLPPEDTRWERVPLVNYAIELAASARSVRILHNVIKRGNSDQISMNGDEAIILGNRIEWGQDMGVTLNGTKGHGHSLVAANLIVKQGGGGIWHGAPATDCGRTSIAGNVIVGSNWTLVQSPPHIGGMALGGVTDVAVVGNVVDGMGRPMAETGMALRNSNDLTLSGNVIARVSARAINFTELCGPNRTRVALDNQMSPTIVAVDHTPVGSRGGLYELAGLAPPEGVVRAAPGSTFRDVMTGRLYLKRTGYDESGWLELT